MAGFSLNGVQVLQHWLRLTIEEGVLPKLPSKSIHEDIAYRFHQGQLAIADI